MSPVATTVQDGKLFHAGGPDRSENADSATGRWVAAITRRLLGRQVGRESVLEACGIDGELNCGFAAVGRRVVERY